MNASVNKSGFTLVELLIVILIIGLLSAISIPMYKKAVEKSKVADALSTMQAVSKSEHGWYLVRNNYTKDFANLDIDLYDKEGNKANNNTLESINYTYELLDSGILASRTNGEYSIYQDYDTKQIMCTPGTHFICDNLGAFTKEPCEKVGLAWANTNSTCYANEEARCKGLYDDSVWNGEFCGYTNTNGQTLNEGMECDGKWHNTCKNSTINAGATCKAYQGDKTCGEATVYGECIGEGSGYLQCAYSTINARGKCSGSGYDACSYSHINGGECASTASHGCTGVNVDNNGVCSGTCMSATVSNGGVCSGGCYKAITNSGGICSGGCQGATVNIGGICTGTCNDAVVNDGGVCSGGCGWSRINNGGICKSSETNYCGKGVNVAYTGTGCCCGDYCGNAPKCDQARCDALD